MIFYFDYTNLMCNG